MNSELLFEMHDSVALITINRPDAHNTLSAGVLEGLGDAYRRCQDDDDIRAAIVTGAGKSFCAGADMSGGGSTFDGAAHSVEISSCPLSVQAWEVRKPVISACNGHAIGAGLGLAMQTDMRVLASDAKYGFLQARRGVQGRSCPICPPHVWSISGHAMMTSAHWRRNLPIWGR